MPSTVTSSTRYTNKSNNAVTYYNQSNALYDAYGNLRQERLWDGSRYIVQSKYTYDSLQRVISAADAKGNMKTQAYDPWGQVNEITDPSGNLYVMAYDMRNNKIMGYFVAKNNIPAYRANTAVNTYKEDYTEEYLDQFGRGVSRKVYTNWPTMSGELSEAYAYDIAGNLVGYTDPKRNLNEDGYTAAYKYDELNRVTEVKDALNQLTCVSYTVLGDISSVVLKQTATGGNTATLYTKSYNELGAVKSRTDASSLATQYSYNTIGLNTKTVDRNGSTQSLTYDALNQLTQATQVSLDGSKSISYKYNYTSPFGYSEQQLYTNGTLTGADSYTYGADGQITQRDITGSVYLSSSLKLQYDDAGRLIDIGAGKQGSSLFYTNYSYTADRLTQVQTNGQQTVSTANTDNTVYEYFPDGKLKKITYPKLNDGTFLTCEYSYNPLGQLASLVNKKGSTILSQFSYTYDENGNIITVNDGQTLKTYVYDKLNRLTEIRPQSGKATKYTYDLMGNRSTEISEKESLNLVNTSYSCSLDNLLQSVTKGTNTTTMTYYADGLRAAKSTSAGTTHYIYDLSGRLVAEGQNTTSVSANYVWGPDRVLSKKDSSGGEYYYLYNGHGDVIQIVDRNGNVANNYKYDEWGNILTSSETISNPFLYAGEVYDKETGLYYLRARYYDPTVGRFINEDTVEGQVNNPLTLNIYTYCFNNPTKYIDSTGNMPVKLLNTYSEGYNEGFYNPEIMSKIVLKRNGLNPYTALHEIAQLNIAKLLYENGILTTLEHRFKGIFSGAKYEVDIMSGEMLYEVKPIYNITAAIKQAENYCDEGGFTMGLELAPILDIPLFGDYYMGIVFQEGVALYGIYRKKEGQKEPIPITNKEFADAYYLYMLSMAIQNTADSIYNYFMDPDGKVPYTGED